ncbi:DUF3710 domain-containing protein [Nocardioides mangrovicus]|uniref:DUF3710 domain-containing protein n=1 Tax=Nocardioides mangrovicus TaxID=2478913 RepID=A0A3L8P3X0_9ACTN|nr:DUF3710 domain-containing protein [Nocardioides mangrovicus]RLV49239.1 DUF3710 domain-containing protein [Nocardioides mangrovicus]
MRLRRRSAATTQAAPAEPVAPTDAGTGPYDADDLDLESDATFADHVDLGGLLVAPPPDGIELRLQVDEVSGEVIAVVLAADDGALELRAFASSRGGDLWAEVRRAIAGETAQHGGTANERSGDFGTELMTQLPVTTPDGQAAVQPTRVIGVTGARWFLRATLLGRPAVEPEDAAHWEDQIRSVVVRRGTGAMPPGEAIALTLPPGAG